MSFRFDGFAGTDSTFPLGDGETAVVLEADGIRHPRSARRPREIVTRYEDLTHLTASPRVLWIGARDSVYVLPRAMFARYDAPERLIAALLERIGERPRGAAQLARMAEVDATGAAAGPARATWTLLAVCLVVYALQIAIGFDVELTGHYSRALVADGDVWRLVTANLLHAHPSLGGVLHIGLNMLALLALGTLVERPLGSARTICVMGVSGVGAMFASGLFEGAAVVGASGVVFGLAGSVLWLEYRCAEDLPAWWRFPRRSLIALLAINAVLGALLPFIAFAAHAGGFLAGAVTTALVAGPVASRPRLGVRAAAVSVVALVTLGVATAGMELLDGDDITARYAARYARLPGISPAQLNDHAWVIAISPEPTRAELEAALMLAERAVSETQRGEATILDTLAEVQYALGMHDAAISTIDEAIARDPEEPYYREQRKRFTGEREADDRPDYAPWLRSPESDSAPPPTPGELTV